MVFNTKISEINNAKFGRERAAMTVLLTCQPSECPAPHPKRQTN